MNPSAPAPGAEPAAQDAKNLPQFEALGLDNALLRAVSDKGYQTPSPIQQKAIPPVLAGRDVMAAAQTGTGKTGGFTLPLLQRLLDGPGPRHLQVRALVLTPTRELAAQVAQSVNDYGKYLPTRCEVVFGGVKINPQIRRLEHGVDVLVATPGRLLDLYQHGAVKFGDLEILVLDEADRMLDMGFIYDIRKILALLPDNRQNLLFSATFAPEIRTLTARILHNPVEVEVAARNATADRVEQFLHPVDKKRKSALLCELVEAGSWQQVLVFTRTKHGANRLAQQLEKSGIGAAAIHGNKSQGARTRALAGFKQGKIRVLVATDIAARGLDIDQLPQVVNFDLPNVPEDYVHRIGRTGRAGASGQAYSLVSADEIKQLIGIEQVIGRHIERDYVPGFEPEHELPSSVPIRRQSSSGRNAPGSGNKGRRSDANSRRNRGSEGQNTARRGRRRPRAGAGSRS